MASAVLFCRIVKAVPWKALPNKKEQIPAHVNKKIGVKPCEWWLGLRLGRKGGTA